MRIGLSEAYWKKQIWKTFWRIHFKILCNRLNIHLGVLWVKIWLRKHFKRLGTSLRKHTLCEIKECFIKFEYLHVTGLRSRELLNLFQRVIFSLPPSQTVDITVFQKIECFNEEPTKSISGGRTLGSKDSKLLNPWDIIRHKDKY